MVFAFSIQAAIGYKMLRPERPQTAEQVRTIEGGVTLDVRDLPALGRQGAPLVLIEFSDYQCPFCKNHAAGVEKQIIKAYVEVGKLKYALANMPLESIHASARLMALSSICAQQQGRLWDMRDKLFETQPTILAFAQNLATQLALDEPRFNSCLSGPEAEQVLARDARLASDLGIHTTPSFALARFLPNGMATVESVIAGAQPMQVFSDVVDKMLPD